MSSESEGKGTRDGPEEQHAIAESLIKSGKHNEGGLVSNEASKEEERIEELAGGKMSDIKALMAAKHAIPAADQSDPVKMGEHYDQMAAKCKANGLNLKAMKDSSKWFNLEKAGVSPKEYTSFDVPLAAGAVRLAVLRLTDAEPDNLAFAVSQATQKILESLPKGSIYHCNDPEHYHVTVQMISHPSDPRPDTFRPGGGLSHSLDHHWIPAPLPSNLQKELEVCQACASASPVPELQVHSIILADSGALLLLFTESSGTVQALRQQISSSLPGANEKQPTILHVTLARLLEAQLSMSDISKIHQLCDDATARLRGKPFKPDSLWHVIEKTFTYVNDDRNSVRCPFKGP